MTGISLFLSICKFVFSPSRYLLLLGKVIKFPSSLRSVTVTLNLGKEVMIPFVADLEEVGNL